MVTVCPSQFATRRTLFLFLFVCRLPLRYTLFPYTTLFRSRSTRSRRPSACVSSSLRGPLSPGPLSLEWVVRDRKSTRLNSSHVESSYAVSSLKKQNHDLVGCRLLML